MRRHLALIATSLVASAATLLVALGGAPLRGALPGLVLFLALLPAALLQGATAPASTLASWSTGLLAGCYAGVALGRWPARRLLGRGG